MKMDSAGWIGIIFGILVSVWANKRGYAWWAYILASPIIGAIALGILPNLTDPSKDFQDKEAALQRLIEREVVVMNAENAAENLSEDEHKVNDMKYSIRESLKQDNETEQGDSLVNGQNPMNAVINKK